MKAEVIRFLKDESGVSMMEYGLLAALIALVSIVAITALGENLQLAFQSLCNGLKTAVGAGGVACG
jgi:pilus assembly protein Flp/PilA